MNTLTPVTFLNFAYGSNMLTSRICERVPSARAIAVASLRGHKLCWHKKSKDGSGKCDVTSSDLPQSEVFGVLYEILASEKTALDRAEGLGAGYREKDVKVECNNENFTAKLYYATDTDPNLLPYSWYKALVVAGARQHKLPIGYIKALEAVPEILDADPVRHSKNMALANAG